MFVTLEGPEGAGKTTLLRSLAERLRALGREVVTTREPGSGPLGPAIRRLLLESGDVPPASELFLFLADRSQHVNRVIRPALAAGAVVLCDRYADSTLVYQAHARGLDETFVRNANAFATGGLLPHLTLLLDLPAEVGLARLANPDRLDAEPLTFHQRVRDGFLREAAGDPRWVVIDANRPPETVFAQAWAALEARLAAGA